MAETTSPILTLHDVHLSIGESSILNGISLELAHGGTVGIIGPNGSGKTTLFNCISGFSYPSTGSITFKGSEITSLPPYMRARLGLGRVFQNFGIFRDMTVLENVVIALETHENISATLLPWGKQPRAIKSKAMEYLDQVGLADKSKGKASSLSGGQMRLLEIIRTLAFGADLFLLDEPTAGVSPKMKDAVAELIQRIEALGKTILIIEHDIQFIQKFCKRVLVLDDGRVVLDDTPEKVRSNSRLQEIYFGAGNA